ncbi:MAG: heme biosynthesis protein HemY [Pseudomonadota bacterium]
MKTLFWILAILALAVALTVAAKHNAGYVLLVYPPYRIELSLNLMITLLLLAFFLGYAMLRLVVNTLRLPERVRVFKRERRQEKARTAMQEGLMAYAEGRHGKAEKLAVAALEMHESPELNALLAARAAHEMKAYDRRDAYLEQAERLAPDAPVARLMTQAELLLDERRLQDALVVLRRLHALSPKLAAALRLELKAQQQAKNWDQVIALVAQLEKRDAIEPVQAEQLKLNAHLENLKRKAFDAVELKAYWQKIPAADRLNSKVALAAAKNFLAMGDGQAALEIIEQSLEKQWDSELVRLYGDCPGKDPLKQLERAENWLKAHPADAALLLSLGKLCTRQELWGKAQSYLEASLSIEPGSEAHLALAERLEKMSSHSEACDHYRQSLMLARQRA